MPSPCLVRQSHLGQCECPVIVSQVVVHVLSRKFSTDTTVFMCCLRTKAKLSSPMLVLKLPNLADRILRPLVSVLSYRNGVGKYVCGG